VDQKSKFFVTRTKLATVVVKDTALRALRPQPTELRRAALRALQRRAAAAADELSVAAAARQRAAQAAALAALADTDVLRCGAVLLVGQDPGRMLRAALEARGCAVAHWLRCAVAGETDAACGPPEGTFSAALLLHPGSAEGAAHALRAAAAALPPGAPALLYGQVVEGCSAAAARRALSAGALFHSAKLLASSADGGAVALLALRADGVAAPQADCVPLPPQTLPGAPACTPPWAVQPGLFCGGALDAMSSALLAHLAARPPPPPRARVCDWGAGSGLLAWALQARQPSIRLTLVECDALALQAARLNVPMARRALLSDGWGSVPRRLRFRLVVSNPPFHLGASDHFGALLGLLRGTPRRLLPGGELFLVSQAQVPVGRLAAACGLRARPTQLDGGRFVAWRCVLARE
jgi:16S rRNA G1207 methylase RsmC